MSRICSIDAAVDHLLQTIEGPIRMGLPLGLGKPNRLVNALYQRLRTLPERQLTLYTALSLGRPAAGGDLQRRFLEPFAERVFADYPELDYLHALRRDELPANIRVERSSTCSPAACWTARRRSSTTSVATTAMSPATSMPRASTRWPSWWRGIPSGRAS